MSNLVNILRQSEKAVDRSAISRGKMPRRCRASWKGGKTVLKARRAPLKRGDYGTQSNYGGEGHSSWWD